MIFDVPESELAEDFAWQWCAKQAFPVKMSLAIGREQGDGKDGTLMLGMKCSLPPVPKKKELMVIVGALMGAIRSMSCPEGVEIRAAAEDANGNVTLLRPGPELDDICIQENATDIFKLRKQ